MFKSRDKPNVINIQLKAKLKADDPGEPSRSPEDVGNTNVPVAISWERRERAGASTCLLYPDVSLYIL